MEKETKSEEELALEEELKALEEELKQETRLRLKKGGVGSGYP